MLLMVVWRNCVNRWWPLCLCLSFCLSACQSVFACQSVYVCLPVPVRQSACQPVVCLCLFMSVGLCLSICLPVCLFACLHVPVSQSACLFVSVHLYVFKGNVQLPVTVTYTHSRRLRSNIWWQLYHDNYTMCLGFVWRYLLNHSTFWNQIWYGGALPWPGVPCIKIALLSSRLRSLWGLI